MYSKLVKFKSFNFCDFHSWKKYLELFKLTIFLILNSKMNLSSQKKIWILILMQIFFAWFKLTSIWGVTILGTLFYCVIFNEGLIWKNTNTNTWNFQFVKFICWKLYNFYHFQLEIYYPESSQTLKMKYNLKLFNLNI